MNKDYDKFLEDSSDDYPKYPMSDREDEEIFKSIKCECSNDCSSCPEPVVIHPNDDEANYNEAFGKSSVNRTENTEDLNIALHNVLQMAQEQTKTYFKDCIEAERLIAEQSIKIVENFLENNKDSNIELALREKKELTADKDSA
tara:strand:+ start:659 stop:1090 length:432 start_codon:yes stop_codon:yes gene_type:complete